MGHQNIRADIQATELQIFELNQKLVELRKANPAVEVPNYTFRTQAGDTTLLELFGDLHRLLAIHNMGQGCRYCTLWADGFNGFLPHLESVMSVVLVSKDDPDTQRRFANARSWRFRLASHGGGNYIKDQTCSEGSDNVPGESCTNEMVIGSLARTPALSAPAISIVRCGACWGWRVSAKVSGRLSIPIGSARLSSTMAVRMCWIS